MNAQGEDVVAGIRTPLPISKRQRSMGAAQGMPRRARTCPSLEERCRALPRAARHRAQLEQHYRDMQDIEFTIERGRL